MTEPGDKAAEKKGIIRRWNLILPLLLTFALLTLVVMVVSRTIYRISVDNAYASGVDKGVQTAGELETYVDTAKSVLWVTADSVDFMLRDGESDKQIGRYLAQETEKQSEQFDENYTGVYGYIRGVYQDGSGWVPPADYQATERDWYLAAMEADGEVTIAKPYVDAQTGSVVLSICKRLENSPTSVLSLDLIIDHVQKVVEETAINGMGICFILDSDGTIISHKTRDMTGKNLAELEDGEELMAQITAAQEGFFEAKYNGETSTVFVSRVMNQWYCVIAISNRELFASMKVTIATTVIVFLIVFVLIAFFYSLAYRNEERSNREAEALKIREQQQAYEAEILRLEKSAADSANQAKSSFLADMSHEIRTPINAVLGMNEMILRETRDKNIRTYAGNVESAGKNLLSIINDILDFSKIESGKMEITDAPYQLSSVLNDVSNMIVFRARAKDLAFHVRVEESIPDELYGDEVRIRQIITNILTNAVKYTREGSVTLTVNTKDRPDLVREEESGEDAALCGFLDLIVSVKDTGIGIKEEDKEKLFSKFSRVDLKQTNTIEGTGLGLAITGNLLKLMHGDVTVESTYGEGSEFIIRVPQGIVSREPIGDFHKKFEQGLLAKKAYRETFRAPDAHILVVDDTEMNLIVMEGLLKNTQVHLDKATSGANALLLTKDTAYDLILMDQRMPEMDGTEALRQIRAQEGGCNRETAVICLTADAVQGAKDRYISLGFTDYLSKPVDADSLEASLTKYLPPEKVVRVPEEEDTADTAAGQPDEDAEGIAAGAGMPALYFSVDALDYEEAKLHLPTDELLEKSLRVFYESIPGNADAMKDCFAEGDYENYTVKVHALKSGALMIGAKGLSRQARELEEAGDRVLKASEDSGEREAGIRFIKEKTPGLLQDYRELQDALKPFLEAAPVPSTSSGTVPGSGVEIAEPVEASVSEMNEAELAELYDAIREFAGMYDQDGIYRLLKQAEGSAIPEGERERFARVKKCVQDSDWSTLQEILTA